MQENFNLIKQIYTWIFSVSKTRFGSGSLGFALAGSVAWFGFIKNHEIDITECRNEKTAKQKEIDHLIAQLNDVREAAQNAYSSGYKVGMADAQVYMDITLDNIARIKGEVSAKKSRATKELKETENLIKQRKEVLRNDE